MRHPRPAPLRPAAEDLRERHHEPGAGDDALDGPVTAGRPLSICVASQSSKPAAPAPSSVIVPRVEPYMRITSASVRCPVGEN